jgi:chemotaxis signal transduction protein
MASIDDNSALLLYRVGPVLCASPCLPISSIIEPPKLTRTPGSGSGRPGIFKYANAIISSLDLRYKFGVPDSEWTDPGRTIVTQLAHAHLGFYVDDILDVISMPNSGWGPLPALLPRGIFTRTLLWKEHIHLYAEFNDLQRIPDSGYLRQYIQHLIEAKQDTKAPRNNTSISATHSAVQTNVSPHAAVPQTTIPATRPANSATTMHNRDTTQTQPSLRPPVRTSTTTPMQPSLTTRSPSRTMTQTTPTSQRKPTPAKQAIATAITTTPRTTTLSSVRIDTAGNTKTLNQREHTVGNQRVRPQREPASPSQHSDTGTLAILFFALLMFAIVAGGLWYILRDDSRPLPQALSTTSIVATSEAPPVQEHTTPAKTNDTPAPVQVDKQVPVSVPQPTPVTTALVSTPPPAVADKPKPLADKVTTPTTNASETQSVHSDYHASIKQDQQGLTITLDAPADDPVFTQAAVQPDETQAIKTESATQKTSVANDAQPNRQASSPPSAPAAKTTTAPQSVEIIHIVVKGDTLWAIAKRYVKDPFRYPELARLSKIKNPDLIYPGNRVRIIKRKRQP